MSLPWRVPSLRIANVHYVVLLSAVGARGWSVRLTQNFSVGARGWISIHRCRIVLKKKLAVSVTVRMCSIIFGYMHFFQDTVCCKEVLESVFDPSIYEHGCCTHTVKTCRSTCKMFGCLHSLNKIVYSRRMCTHYSHTAQHHIHSLRKITSQVSSKAKCLRIQQVKLKIHVSIPHPQLPTWGSFAMSSTGHLHIFSFTLSDPCRRKQGQLIDCGHYC